MRKKGFTLVELLVVISIIALLLAILMPSLQKAKKQAAKVVCLSNIKQWGLIINLYTEDNNNTFWKWDFGWMHHLQPYYSEQADIRLCPLAKKNKEYIYPPVYGSGSTYTAWDVSIYFQNPNLDDTLVGHNMGSYGLNEWMLNISAGELAYGGFSGEDHWRRITSIAGRLNRIPMVADSLWTGGWPDDVDMPPTESDEWASSNTDFSKNMRRFCIDRHSGCVNTLFADLSARKVDLKELWKLKWHRSFNTNGMWTLSGGGSSGRWDAIAPWMSGFPEY